MENSTTGKTKFSSCNLLSFVAAALSFSTFFSSQIMPVCSRLLGLDFCWTPTSRIWQRDPPALLFWGFWTACTHPLLPGSVFELAVSKGALIRYQCVPGSRDAFRFCCPPFLFSVFHSFVCKVSLHLSWCGWHTGRSDEWIPHSFIAQNTWL